MTMLLAGYLPCFPSAVQLKGRGKSCVSSAGTFLGEQLRPTDAQSTAVVTFKGVNAGSEIRVFTTGGADVSGVESCDADHVLSWPAYGIGSASNNVVIRIVHPTYKTKEFDYTTLTTGAQGLPIQQEIDKWYSNP